MTRFSSPTDAALELASRLIIAPADVVAEATLTQGLDLVEELLNEAGFIWVNEEESSALRAYPQSDGSVFVEVDFWCVHGRSDLTAKIEVSRTDKGWEATFYDLVIP